MKSLLLITAAVLVLTGCYGATSFSNRSIVYQISPQMKGEHSQVTGSPTNGDSTVNAEKSFESATKANIAQNLNDTSSNDQHKEVKEQPENEQK